MDEVLYIDNFEADPVILFDKKTGIAINPAKSRIIVFEKNEDGFWLYDEMELSDIRSIERISLTASELMTFTHGGAKGIGEALGASIKNSMDRSKASKGSGVKIYLRSMETPSVFISIPYEGAREEAYEALHQAIDGGSLNGSLSQIPNEIYKFFHRPTPEEIEQERLDEERGLRRYKAIIPSIKQLLIVTIIAGMGVWPSLWAYDNQLFSYASDHPLLRAIIFEDLPVFFVCWFVLALLASTTWKVLRA